MDSQRRSKLTATVIVAAVVVAVALIAALIMAVVDGDDDSAGESAPPPSSGPAEPPATATSDEDAESIDVDLIGRRVTLVDAPGGTPREQTGQPGAFPEGQEMVGPPAGLELQRVSSGATVMVSRSDGPTDLDGEVMTGYAHSPGGAALVAANFAGLGMEMGAAYADFLQQFMPDAVAEDPAVLDEIRSRGASADGRALTAAQGYQAPRWFRFQHCDEQVCTVEAAMPSIAEAVGEIESIDVGPHDHQVVRVSLEWTGEQWEILSSRAMPPVVEIDGTWSPWT